DRPKEYGPLVLDLDDGFLEQLEDARRRGPGDAVPVDAPENGLAQLDAARSREGAGFEVAGEALFLAEPRDAPAADHQASAVAPAGDEELPERPAPGPLQVAVPLAEPLERVLTLRVEHEHRQRRLVHEELVDQSVVGLAGEVPEPDLT